MNRLVVVFYLIVGINLGAFAHQMAYQDTVGVTLHIEPNDEPLAGSLSQFSIWIKDSRDLMTPQNCDGTFSVLSNGVQLVMKPLFANATGSELFSSQAWTFPKQGVYTVRIAGMPNVNQSFQPFSIDFDIRVEHQAGFGESDGDNSDHTVHIILTIGLSFGATALVWILFRKRAK